MNNQFRFQLASNKFPKLNCPYCHKKKHWQRYYDTITEEVLPEQYGRCDNAIKCEQELSPYKDGYAQKIWEKENGYCSKGWYPKPSLRKKPTFKPTKTYYIPEYILDYTFSSRGYQQNTFIQNLLYNIPYPFDWASIEKVISMYKLGTIQKGFRKGALTFPFIDFKGNIRTIQVKEFDKANHTTGTDFLHSMIDRTLTNQKKTIPQWLVDYKRNEKKVSCLFGEHQLNTYPHNPIALVEAPKTAIYATLYFGIPKDENDFLWLAVYNLGSLTYQKCKILQGRTVFLFPDLSKKGNAFKEWRHKAKVIESKLPNTTFHIDNLLEQNAPSNEREKGSDLADFLIQFNWRKFR